MIRPGDNAKKWIFLCSGIACLLVVFVAAALFRGKFAAEEEIVPISVNAAPEDISEEPVSSKWAVYVTGEVMFPGMYEIEPGSRVNDALRAAGGFSPRADREAVNIAAKLRDEAHISVPAIHENPRAETETPKPMPAVPSSGGAGTRGVSYPASVKAEEKDSKIDLNRADAESFATLPGIGPKLSAAIVAYREENGPFGSVEELRSVSGIGEKRFEAVRELVTVSNR
ncbi:MAG: ComEA family DNA-binding protein [Synergistaceae bacterium]|jgi:competence protein ComEA|nr:ComEA family DNA-binding protein [Synergistaceae bacterium]